MIKSFIILNYIFIVFVTEKLVLTQLQMIVNTFYFEFVLHHRQLDSYVKLYVTVLNII